MAIIICEPDRKEANTRKELERDALHLFLFSWPIVDNANGNSNSTAQSLTAQLSCIIIITPFMIVEK